MPQITFVLLSLDNFRRNESYFRFLQYLIGVSLKVIGIFELVFHRHNHFYVIERVQTEVVDEMRVQFQLMDSEVEQFFQH